MDSFKILLTKSKRITTLGYILFAVQHNLSARIPSNEAVGSMYCKATLKAVDTSIIIQY